MASANCSAHSRFRLEEIQRKGNESYFKALCESIELDQIRRGVLPAKAE